MPIGIGQHWCCSASAPAPMSAFDCADQQPARSSGRPTHRPTSRDDICRSPVSGPNACGESSSRRRCRTADARLRTAARSGAKRRPNSHPMRANRGRRPSPKPSRTNPRCRQQRQQLSTSRSLHPLPAPAALHVADGCRRPLLARLRRIHPPDRPAHRRWLRPAVERYRRDASGSIPTAGSPKALAHARRPGAASRWTGRSMAADACRSSCRACRSTITLGTSPAIAVSASAAISTALTGLRRCAAPESVDGVGPAAAVVGGYHRGRSCRTRRLLPIEVSRPADVRHPVRNCQTR